MDDDDDEFSIQVEMKHFSPTPLKIFLWFLAKRDI